MKNQHALNLGLSLAAIGIVVFLLMAILPGNLWISMVLGIVSLGFAIYLPIRFTKKQRREQGGYITFKEVFLTAITGLVLSAVISFAFTYVYTSFIDTGYVDRQVKTSVKGTMKWLEGNMADEQMEEILRETEEKTREGFTPMGMVKSFGIYLAVYAVFSLILAAVIKNEPEREVSSGSEELIDR
ncbi:MAG: DUF4199 domain-containing protein [Cryomorphaceae bacterium]|nr:DUF4199 domain-containing protein [Flavobacteriales bacterium]